MSTIYLNAPRFGGANWWEEGGATGAVAVYQPKGAASLAASLVDLSGNGNDATNNSATWDSTNGWKRVSNVGYIDTGVQPSASSWTFIVRFSDLTLSLGFAYFGKKEGSTKDYLIGLIQATTNHSYINNGLLSVAGTNTSGVYCIAGQTGYYNGSSDGAIPTSWSGGSTYSIYILGANQLATTAWADDVYVQAVAIYNNTLTAPQVAAVSTAMAAL